MRVFKVDFGFGKMLTVGMVMSAASVATAATTPVYEFQFNDSGVTTANTGSQGGSGTMLDQAGAAADLHSLDAAGVSGKPGDLAFDNSGSSAMGKNGVGGRVSVPSPAALDGVAAITLSGWFKTAGETPVSSAAYLLDLGVTGAGKAGINVTAGSSSLRVTLFGDPTGATDYLEVSNAAVNQTETWMFIAATYDSTVSGADNLKIYLGTADGALQLLAAKEVSVGALSISPAKDIAIGNVSGASIRPFDGMIDNVRIHDTALSASELEEIRLNDVPEPSGASVLLLGGAVLLSRRRKVEPNTTPIA